MESFEELQQLFEEMFQEDINSPTSGFHIAAGCSTSSTYMAYTESSSVSSKSNCTEMNLGKAEDSSDFNATFHNSVLGHMKHLQGMKIRTKGNGKDEQATYSKTELLLS